MTYAAPPTVTQAAEIERLERAIAPLKAVLFAATTHHAIPADYALGWERRAVVWESLGPLIDALRNAKLEKACDARRSYKGGRWV